ncbi:MAG: hypothetical protein WCY15_07230 [Phenylobacterium sp.]|jgi:hypothetical protein|uniref:hypothetical protein n=1 Tax=Phenylobacterium sp. TaxID=1871053 RepID=UPI002A34CA3F|nr:hypothetical protein [Phenylobacterium sp.]MDD3837457.1 hypothetical protein [Phenylobacterium sp.]MDX9996436.1 hypothetical protein [Phenylobacterium sp.]
MRTAALAIAAAATLAAWGTAASARVSDTDFIRASRCHALASASGSAHAAALASVTKAESRGRADTVVRMADKAAAKAANEARSDSAEKRAKVAAELDGVCQAFLGDKSTGTASSSTAASPAS